MKRTAGYIWIAPTLGLSTLVGCGVSRPQPRMVEPGFSYIEDGPQHAEAGHGRADRGELALQARPGLGQPRRQARGYPLRRALVPLAKPVRVQPRRSSVAQSSATQQ